MTTTPGPDDATVEQCLHLGHGFREEERPHVVELLSKVDRHLVGRAAGGVRIDLQVKDRDTVQQKVTLEAELAGLPTTVATAEGDELWTAVAHARDELVRQLEDAKEKRLPNHRS